MRGKGDEPPSILLGPPTFRSTPRTASDHSSPQLHLDHAGRRPGSAFIGGGSATSFGLVRSGLAAVGTTISQPPGAMGQGCPKSRTSTSRPESVISLPESVIPDLQTPLRPRAPSRFDRMARCVPTSLPGQVQRLARLLERFVSWQERRNGFATGHSGKLDVGPSAPPSAERLAWTVPPSSWTVLATLDRPCPVPLVLRANLPRKDRSNT